MGDLGPFLIHDLTAEDEDVFHGFLDEVRASVTAAVVVDMMITSAWARVRS